MDLMLIELLLWGGLLFFIWALKDGLSHVENDIESLGLLRNAVGVSGGKRRVTYCRPERVADPIGQYLGAAIYRYLVIDGRDYEFDRVRPDGSEMEIETSERCVLPGLVYQECNTRPGRVA
jgi:hypothetical protein